VRAFAPRAEGRAAAELLEDYLGKMRSAAETAADDVVTLKVPIPERQPQKPSSQ
jgi:hypothetical protein